MEQPLIILTRAERTLLGLEKYPTQIMTAKLVLPICEPLETCVEDYFAQHTSPKNVSLDVDLYLPPVQLDKDQDWNFESALSKSAMSSVELTPEQQNFHGLEKYPPQTMIAKLVLPVYEEVKIQVINYFAKTRQKRHLAVKVILPGVPLGNSSHGLKDACTQTESVWSQTESKWPPTKLQITQSDEEEELFYQPKTRLILDMNKKLLQIEVPPKEDLSLQRKTLNPGQATERQNTLDPPVPTPQLLLNNESKPFVQSY